MRTLTSCTTISTAKRTPPNGVLKVAAIPPAAPAAISVMRSQVVSLNFSPTYELTAEPIWMMGPSRPTEPPLPIDSAEASDLTTATRGRILPSW